MLNVNDVVDIFNFENILYVALIFPLLNLSKLMLTGKELNPHSISYPYSYFLLSTSKISKAPNGRDSNTGICL